MTDITITDRWNELLALFPAEAQDLYFREEYLRLYERGPEKARCFLYREDDNLLLFPFLLRPFTVKGERHYDLESPYGYGGPIVRHDDPAFIDRALRTLLDYGHQEGYVAGFVRFHPLLRNDRYCQRLGSVEPVRQTVAIDLRRPIEEVWQCEIHPQNRNTIRRAAKNGLHFAVDEAFDYQHVFFQLYTDTMRRLAADPFYYFDDRYFDTLRDTLPGRFLGVVIEAGEVIAAGLFLYGGPYGHYHLSGSDPARRKFGPNNLLLWEAAREMQRRGVRWFHLGGGTDNNAQNSLLQFKQRFSQGSHPFAVGKILFDEGLYRRLCAEWEEIHPERVTQYGHWFLKYKY